MTDKTPHDALAKLDVALDLLRTQYRYSDDDKLIEEALELLKTSIRVRDERIAELMNDTLRRQILAGVDLISDIIKEKGMELGEIVRELKDTGITQKSIDILIDNYHQREKTQ